MSDDATTIWAEISEAVWSLSALSSPSDPSGYIHRSLGDTVARRGGGKCLAKESGAPAVLGTQGCILMEEDVLSLLLPSALSQCLWFLSVLLLLPRHSGNVCPGSSEWGLWGECWGWQADILWKDTASLDQRRLVRAIAPRYRKPSLLHLQDSSA